MDISSECRETALTTRKDNRTEIFKYLCKIDIALYNPAIV
jgi:hypothetical protein